tara:strand:+ start:1064 stop:1399 length:336 start_codon:yes stop_codon:yes gene_type:complete
MRYPNYLINAFAILGLVSFVFLVCSASETVMDNEDPIENGIDNNVDNNENPPIQNNYGKYQMSVIAHIKSNGGGRGPINYTTILNTETGDVRYYKFNGSSYENIWYENLAN